VEFAKIGDFLSAVTAIQPWSFTQLNLSHRNILLKKQFKRKGSSQKYKLDPALSQDSTTIMWHGKR
jgi:hypothetical protein